MLVVVVEFTSWICTNHDANCNIQKSLHDGDLENGLRGRGCSGHDMQKRNPANKKCCPNGVVGDLELHDQRSQDGLVRLRCGDLVVGAK